MSKKLLSVILALALALSCFAVSAFALGDIGYEGDEDAAYYTQAWALGEPEVDGDGNYVVDVTLDANYYVGPIQFKVIKTVSTGSLTLVDAYEGDDIPSAWNADVSFDDKTGEVAVIPAPTMDADALNCEGGKVIATLVYEASADVAATLVIDIADAKNASNPDGTLIAARMSDGNVVRSTALTGQTVSDKTNTVSIGAAVSNPPKLVVVDGTIGVIDTSRTDLDADAGTSCDGYLLGIDIDVNGSVSELFEVVGDGTMNVIANDQGCDYTTGAMVQVLDLDGNVVAEYVVIVFGDVNGDCAIDPTDASIIELHDGWEERVPTYQEFAGDVNADFATDPTDASVIELHDGWEERMDLATILAGFGF